MVMIEQTKDVEIVDRIAHTEEVWRDIIDDSTPENASLKSLVDDPNNIFLALTIDGFQVGFMGFLSKGDGVYEMHTNFTNACRGKLAMDSAMTCISWVFRNLNASKIVTYAFSTAKPALLMLRVAGWTYSGSEPYPIKVKGKDVEKIMFSLERSDWEKQNS